jgi:hypothetical protein
MEPFLVVDPTRELTVTPASILKIPVLGASSYLSVFMKDSQAAYRAGCLCGSC